MNAVHRIAPLALAVALAACAAPDQPIAPHTSATGVAAARGGTQSGDRPVYNAHLTGDEEVPARATRAQGQATFRWSADGSALEYKLIVANITNVHMAHLHLAPAGENGQIVVWLYPPGPPPLRIEGRTQGVLAEGSITAAELVGPLEGQTLDALVAAIEAGSVYVNVHTIDPALAPNSGPGNFPGGEIRGQLP